MRLINPDKLLKKAHPMGGYGLDYVSETDINIAQSITIEEIEDKIMNLQTYKMFVGEEDVYVDRNDVISVLRRVAYDLT